MLAHQASFKKGEWSDAAFAVENKITGLRVQRDASNVPCSIQARYVRKMIWNDLYLLQVRLSMGRKVEEDQLRVHSKVRQRDDVGVRFGRPENCDGRDRDLLQQRWQHLRVQSDHERRRRVESRQSKDAIYFRKLAAVSLFHSACPLPQRPLQSHKKHTQGSAQFKKRHITKIVQSKKTLLTFCFN